jgi:hypothetical protein
MFSAILFPCTASLHLMFANNLKRAFPYTATTKSLSHNIGYATNSPPVSENPLRAPSLTFQVDLYHLSTISTSRA